MRGIFSFHLQKLAFLDESENFPRRSLLRLCYSDEIPLYPLSSFRYTICSTNPLIFSIVFFSPACKLYELPVPIATTCIGSSAVMVLIPDFLSISSSSPLSMAPPPVSMIPRSRISADSSGGVRSSTPITASTICPAGSRRASSVSDEGNGHRLWKAGYQISPPDFHGFFFDQRIGCPDLILMSSAVRSPIRRLCFFRTKRTMASSKSSPASFRDVFTTVPPREITAISESAASDIHDHVATGSGDIDPRSDRSRYRLLDQDHFPGACRICGLLYCLALHLRYAAWHADTDTGLFKRSVSPEPSVRNI